MAPRTPPHPAADELRAFSLGRLSGPAADEVRCHLADCPECRHRADQARTVATLPPASPPPPGVTGIVMGAAPAPAADLRLPPELANHPDYEVVRELGRGGMGVVYLARNRLMDRLEVLKVLGRGLLDRPEAVERFKREIVAAARLRHPNIVTAYSVARAGDLLMLAMEYVEGMDLARYVAEYRQRKGKLPPVAHACHFIRQAAQGLQHAAEQGLVHRDVKPHNLMLTPKGQVKILDFGLARLREQQPGQELTSDRAVMGTPAFMAPEQALDARSADIRADLYALGGTLFYLLTGRPPFEADTTMKLMLAHMETPPPAVGQIRPEVPAGLAAVVARLLAKKPEDRYQTPAEVAAALAPFARGRVPVAAPAADAVSAVPIVPDDFTDTSPGTGPHPASPAAPDSQTLVEMPKPAVGSSFSPRRRPRRSRRLVWLVGGIALAVLLAGAIATWVGLRPGAEPAANAGGPAAEAVAASPRKAHYWGSGVWKVEDGELVQEEAEATITGIAFGDPNWTDYDFTFEVKRTGGDGRCNAAVRLRELGKFVAVSLPGAGQSKRLSAWELGVAQDAVESSEGADAGDGEWHTVTLRARGPKYTLTVDNAELLELEADRFPQGRVALATSQSAARFKNLRVTDPNGATLWEGLPELPGARATWSDPSITAVAAWRYTHLDDNSTAIHDLYSNGHIDSPFSVHLWTRQGDTLTWYWKDDKAPGGAWVVTCTVAEDGRSFTGQSKEGRQVRGELVERPAP